MTHVDSSVTNGGDALVRLADQLPPGIDIGRPVLITPDGTVLTTDGHATAVYELDPDGQGASRLASTSGGLGEVTLWRGRREVSRSVVDDDGPDDGGGGGGGGGGGDDPGPEPVDSSPGCAEESRCVVHGAG